MSLRAAVIGLGTMGPGIAATLARSGCAYISERTSQGKLGMKTGSGIFSYTSERINALRSQRGTKLGAVRRALER